MSDAKFTPRQRLLITVAVMSATVMQVLDTTIVNVALPHMQGQLGATRDQIAWVLTSYLVSSGIFMPLTGFFTDRLGQRRYLMLSIAGFVISSALCGLSTNIDEIVFFRLAQGVFGAALVPLSQSIMVQTYPLEERGKAMAIWGMGVMVGPILGPTLGGFLTQAFSWRWTFFINVPVGIFALALALRVVPDTAKRARSLDWTGFALIAAAIGTLQYILDRGNEVGWFSSRTIVFLSVFCVLAFVAYIDHSIRKGEDALFRMRLFRDRNFTTASAMIAIMGLGLFGAALLQPEMLEDLLKYPALTAGLVMAPRGVASMLSMFAVGRLIGRVDARVLIGIGISFATVGSWLMTWYSLNIDFFWVIFPIVLQGLGLGLIFVPMSTIAFSTLAPSDSAEAAGMFSLMRTIGSSIGISIVTTVLTQHTQIAWNQLGGHITAINPALHAYLRHLGLSLHDPATPAVLGQVLAQQANMIAFNDSFMFITWGFIVMFPLLLILRGGGLKNRK
ncbi:DHA2 family efflux MFS transporter permease subunit [Acidihalobacter ferrooxydans]|uniref:MFS transporter n=1 Tax=Acidihalobacter ferrooxydans TaxID=1765967 RepID=A0A1P8UKM4_9GAMM|nr:DHA2 family efflux MFS transporter permease subunit [Acidihalobacter ferrooxydans]APZ44397.1 MFS transporter [Acidihalobacter ferrooxydans]